MQLRDLRHSGGIMLLGANQVYCMGDTAYRLQPLGTFENGMGCTLNTFAHLRPVSWINGEWWPSQLTKPLIKNWSEEITQLSGEYAYKSV